MYCMQQPGCGAGTCRTNSQSSPFQRAVHLCMLLNALSPMFVPKYVLQCVHLCWEQMMAWSQWHL
jgi:hypothetical protein